MTHHGKSGFNTRLLAFFALALATVLYRRHGATLHCQRLGVGHTGYGDAGWK